MAVEHEVTIQINVRILVVNKAYLPGNKNSGNSVISLMFTMTKDRCDGTDKGYCWLIGKHV